MNIFSAILQFDNFVTAFIFNLPSNTFAILLMRFFSLEGMFALVWLLILGIIYKFHFAKNHKPRLLIEIIVILLIANAIINAIIKPFFSRPRPHQGIVASYPEPSNVLDRITAIPYLDDHKPPETVAYPSDFSFPSGHATLAFALASLMCIKNKKYSTCYLTFASLVAFSRVYLGYHYFLDVVFGGLIGWTTTRLFIRAKTQK